MQHYRSFHPSPGTCQQVQHRRHVRPRQAAGTALQTYSVCTFSCTISWNVSKVHTAAMYSGEDGLVILLRPWEAPPLSPAPPSSTSSILGNTCDVSNPSIVPHTKRRRKTLRNKKMREKKRKQQHESPTTTLKWFSTHVEAFFIA